MFFILLAILGLVAILQFVKCYGRLIYLSRNIPGPPALPIIGNALLLWNKTLTETYAIIMDTIKKYGTVVRFWIGPNLIVFLTDPADVEVLLSSQTIIEKSREYNVLKPWLGTGLLISTGKKWQSRRTILEPAFHYKILEQTVKIFDNQSQTLVNVLSKYKPTESVNMYPYIKHFALDVICESIMGTKVFAQTDANSQYALAAEEFCQIVVKRAFDLVLRNEFLFYFSRLRKRYEDALKILHTFSETMIRKRRQELFANGPIVENNMEEIGIRSKHAFLDILLRSSIDGKPLSDLDIREEVDTFMFVGHVSVTSAIAFSLYHIAKDRQIQAKCYNEIIETIGEDKTKPVTFADLNRLTYLEKVIKEALRLYPPVPIVGRYLSKDIEINGKQFAAGCTLALSMPSMGLDAKLYDNPTEFRPDRFDLDNIWQKGTNLAYVPFSAGPRKCIGPKFAMLEIKCVLSKLLRYHQFRLTESELSAGPVLSVEIILKPANGISLHLSSRK